MSNYTITNMFNFIGAKNPFGIYCHTLDARILTITIDNIQISGLLLLVQHKFAAQHFIFKHKIFISMENKSNI